MFPTILAHGALGAFDEIIFLGVGVVFLVMMGISWLRSRNMKPEFDDPGIPAKVTTTEQQPDRFKLE
ncbi:MAG TPA: hypothetical protein VK003_18625 [Oceanobacillus sp.]|nr:hypothetical protein [Oceanobacillus sp.]